LKKSQKTVTLGTAQGFRAVYVAPVLKQFGLVGALTQGGTVATPEQTQMCDQGNKALMC